MRRSRHQTIADAPPSRKDGGKEGKMKLKSSLAAVDNQIAGHAWVRSVQAVGGR